MKFREIEKISNHVADKNLNNRRIRRLPFPIILCIAIILATSLIYYSIASTEGGPDNSGGFKISMGIALSHHKTAVAKKDSKPAKDKSEVATDSNTTSSNEQNVIDDKKTSDEKKKVVKSSERKGKTWIPPVYKYVNHPAETRTVTTYSCKGGTFTSMDALRSAQQKYIRSNHLPGWDGTFSNIQTNVKTEIVKEAWTEQVLVKEGYWK